MSRAKSWAHKVQGVCGGWLGAERSSAPPSLPVGRAKLMGKGLTVGRGRVALTLICADEHGEG